MAKKLIISESQYEKLLQLLNETPFDIMLDNTMDIGDKLVITHSSGKNIFRINKKIKNGIVLTNEDKRQYRYFMNHESMKSNNTLEFRVVDAIAEPEKVESISKWRTEHYQGVISVKVIKAETNVIADSFETEGKLSEQPQGPDSNLIANFVKSGNSLEIGQRLILTTATGELSLCCHKKDGDSMQLVMDHKNTTQNISKGLARYDYFILNFGEHPVSLNKDGTFDLQITEIDVDPQTSVVDYIHNVRDFAIDKCEADTGGAGAGDSDGGAVPSGTGVGGGQDGDGGGDGGDGQTLDRAELMNGKSGTDIYKDILDDPDMQEAFFSQPGLWKSVVAFLRGKNPPPNRSRGIVAALKYWKRFMDEKVANRIGPGFNGGGKDILFEMDRQYELRYHRTNESTWRTYYLSTDQLYGKTKQTKLKGEEVPYIVYKLPGLNDDDEYNTPLAAYIRLDKPAENERDVMVCKIIVNPSNKSPKKKDNLGGYTDPGDNDKLLDAEVTLFQSKGWGPPTESTETPTEQ